MIIRMLGMTKASSLWNSGQSWTWMGSGFNAKGLAGALVVAQFLVERRNWGIIAAMMSIIFVPTRSLPPAYGVPFRRPPSFLRGVVIRAAAKREPAPAVFRPSVSSIVKTLNAGHVSVLEVSFFTMPPFLFPFFLRTQLFFLPPRCWKARRPFSSLRTGLRSWKALESKTTGNSHLRYHHCHTLLKYVLFIEDQKT